MIYRILHMQNLRISIPSMGCVSFLDSKHPIRFKGVFGCLKKTKIAFFCFQIGLRQFIKWAFLLVVYGF